MAQSLNATARILATTTKRFDLKNKNRTYEFERKSNLVLNFCTVISV